MKVLQVPICTSYPDLSLDGLLVLKDLERFLPGNFRRWRSQGASSYRPNSHALTHM